MLAGTVATAGFVTHPAAALAAALNASGTHVVLFQSQGTQTEHATKAQTVAEFLRERGIVPQPGDYVHPALWTPLADNMFVEYAPAIVVRLITPGGARTVTTTASDVGSFLDEQGIDLGDHDVVLPSLSDPLAAHATIRIMRVLRWVSTLKQRIAQRTIHVIDFSLPPGSTRMLKTGKPGLALAMVDFTQTDGVVSKRVVSRRIVRKPQARVVAEGVGTPGAIADFASRGLKKTAYIAAGAIKMVATAYTAQCWGCSGYTASGYRAGHGIVAVDPRVIPLGTKLYIPGYGFAIAGDTGGAIVGDRIDLGFDSLGDAMSFGRRPVKVYTLK